MICDPLTPIFLPKNPDDIEASKGKIIIAKYIYLNSIAIVPLNLYDVTNIPKPIADSAPATEMIFRANV